NLGDEGRAARKPNAASPRPTRFDPKALPHRGARRDGRVRLSPGLSRSPPCFGYGLRPDSSRPFEAYPSAHMAAAAKPIASPRLRSQCRLYPTATRLPGPAPRGQPAGEGAGEDALAGPRVASQQHLFARPEGDVRALDHGCPVVERDRDIAQPQCSVFPPATSDPTTVADFRTLQPIQRQFEQGNSPGGGGPVRKARIIVDE